MQKDDLVYVGHMLDTARLIIRRTAGKPRDMASISLSAGRVGGIRHSNQTHEDHQ